MAELRKTVHQIHLTQEFLFDRLLLQKLVGTDIEVVEVADARMGDGGDLVLTVIGRADPDKVSFGDKEAA